MIWLKKGFVIQCIFLKIFRKMKLCMFILSVLPLVFGYKPVVLVHGVLSEASHLEDMQRMIEQAHPGTNVTLVKLYPQIESFVPLQKQISFWRLKLEPIMADAPEGIHLICHSQGIYNISILFS